MKALPLLVLLAALLALGGCADSEAQTRAAEDLPGAAPPPIVLVSIDTLRSDHLPAYGYREVETPAIDALVRDGVLFEHAYSPMPLTLPAHASMMTGLLPAQHGIRDNMGYRLEDRGTPLAAERLRDLGYATGASVSSFVLRRDTGISRGFEFFDDEVEPRPGLGAEGLQRRGPETLEAVVPWLRTVAGKPFFLFLHLYEPHAPYHPPEPWASRYASAYDGEIAAADRVVGELVAELERLGIYDRAAVVITSDHGEGLGDHGEEEHGLFLYRESLQVPLILKLPGQRSAGTTVDAPAQLADIAPTLIALAGGERTTPSTAVSLLDLMEGAAGERTLSAESYYPRLYFGWSEQLALIDRRYQYIGGAIPELFDLEADPGETDNLADRLPEVAASYQRRLDAMDWRSSRPSWSTGRPGASSRPWATSGEP